MKVSLPSSARSGEMLVYPIPGFCSQVCILSLDILHRSLGLLIAEDNTRMVVHHNPLPDITHEDFVSLLGPLLAPENYPSTGLPSGPSNPQLASSTSLASPSNPRPSTGSRPPASPMLFNPNSPAPFDWLHFEGRTVKTTLNNITGLDGLARERKWRSHCVFSIDIGRKGRQGVEAVCFYL